MFAIEVKPGFLGSFNLQDSSGRTYKAIVFTSYQEAVKVMANFDVGEDARIVEVKVEHA